MTIRVLVVEDESVAAQAHAAYVERLPGFEVAAVARTAAAAARCLREDPTVDLILLDMNLPDTHGLNLLQQLRASGRGCDVIAVTAARDTEVVRHAVTNGVVAYLLKPFTYASFSAKLQQYAAYREQLSEGSPVEQDDVDQLFAAMRSPGSGQLPKGMSAQTLDLVQAELRRSADPLAASAVAERIGASRVTARRYLEYLADQGQVSRSAKYGSPGRPEIRYALADATG